ncbi:MAG: protein disulfide oxidoreductase [Candidatus Parcubacteria bacterium]|jgi:disulfide bond formation protein DsbB
MKKVIDLVSKNALYLALIQVIVAILGSLYFSEIKQYPPCVLCWYQRIAMYPLMLILIIGILTKDKLTHYYVLSLTFIGWLISIYHNLLYYKVLPEAAAPCVAGISCTTKYIEWFGFVTIPLLAFLGFSTIIILMFLHRRYIRSEQN